MNIIENWWIYRCFRVFIRAFRKLSLQDITNMKNWLHSSMPIIQIYRQTYRDLCDLILLSFISWDSESNSANCYNFHCCWLSSKNLPTLFAISALLIYSGLSSSSFATLAWNESLTFFPVVPVILSRLDLTLANTDIAIRISSSGTAISNSPFIFTFFYVFIFTLSARLCFICFRLRFSSFSTGSFNVKPSTFATSSLSSSPLFDWN